MKKNHYQSPAIQLIVICQSGTTLLAGSGLGAGPQADDITDPGIVEV